MLSKDPDDPFNPLAYRLLLITPILYRAWAKLRLSHLQDWISSWALEHMYGGMQGVGASEAWFATSIEVQWSLVSKIPLIGGALDLFKCFDQIMRPLLYAVLRIAGLPTQVLTAYMNYQEHVKIYNSMNGALGAAHQHPFGIPQGCLFSIVFVGLLLRPWQLQMIALGAIPRTLADDLLLMAKGS